MRTIELRYLGMKGDSVLAASKNGLPRKVQVYYEDLRQPIAQIYWALKPEGRLAIGVGDSTVNGKKIPTTLRAKQFCEEAGFKFERIIFNPLLGAHNRAIRGERWLAHVIAISERAILQETKGRINFLEFFFKITMQILK